MSELTTEIKIIEVTPAELDEPSEGYCSGEYRIKVQVGEDEVTVGAWCHCGWLVPGASGNLDGSGLANWGASQPGGWSVCDGDGTYSGRVRVLSSSSDDYDDPILIGSDHLDSQEVGSEMVPEWAVAVELVDLLEEGGDDHETAIKAARAVRDAIIERLASVLEGYSVDCPEPEAEEVYEELEPIDGIEGLPVRFGNYKGAGPVIAWKAGDRHEMDYHPNGTPSGLRDAIAARVDEIIAGAVAAQGELSD